MAGGHPGSIVTDEQWPGCVLKPCNNNEAEALQGIMTEAPELQPFAPAYHGRRPGEDGREFVVIQNLVHGLQDPVVMDIKMGTRTFELSEAGNTEPRADLLAKVR